MNEPKIEILSNYEDGMIRPEEINPLVLKRPTFKTLENVEVSGNQITRSTGYSSTKIGLPASFVADGYSIVEYGFKAFSINMPTEQQCYLLVAKKFENPLRLYMYPSIQHDGTIIQEWEDLTENYDGIITNPTRGSMVAVSGFPEKDYKWWNVKNNNIFPYTEEAFYQDERLIVDSGFTHEKYFLYVQDENIDLIWFSGQNINVARNRFTRILQNEIPDSANIVLNKFSISVYANVVRMFIPYVKDDVEKVLGIVFSPILKKEIKVINYRCPIWRFDNQPVAGSVTTPGLTGTYKYKIVFVTASGDSEASVSSNSIRVSGTSIKLPYPTRDMFGIATGRKIYRTTNGGNVYGLVTTINHNNLVIEYIDNVEDSALLFPITPIEDIAEIVSINKWQITNYDIKGLSDTLKFNLEVATFFDSPFLQTVGNYYKFIMGFVLNGYQYANLLKNAIFGGGFSYTLYQDTALERFIVMKTVVDLAKLDLRVSDFLVGVSNLVASDYFPKVETTEDPVNPIPFREAIKAFDLSNETTENFIVIDKNDNFTIQRVISYSKLNIDFEFCSRYRYTAYIGGIGVMLKIEEEPDFSNLGTMAGLLNRFGSFEDIYNLDYSPKAKVIRQIGERLYFVNLLDKPDWVRFNSYSGNGVSMPDIAPMSEDGGLGYFIANSNQPSKILGIAGVNNNQNLIVLKDNETFVYNVAGSKTQIRTLIDVFKDANITNINSLNDESNLGVFWQGDNGTYLYVGGKEQPIDLSKDRIRRWLLDKLPDIKDTLSGIWLGNTNQYMLFYIPRPDIIIIPQEFSDESHLTTDYELTLLDALPLLSEIWTQLYISQRSELLISEIIDSKLIGIGSSYTLALQDEPPLIIGVEMKPHISHRSELTVPQIITTILANIGTEVINSDYELALQDTSDAREIWAKVYILHRSELESPQITDSRLINISSSYVLTHQDEPPLLSEFWMRIYISHLSELDFPQTGDSKLASVGSGYDLVLQDEPPLISDVGMQIYISHLSELLFFSGIDTKLASVGTEYELNLII